MELVAKVKEGKGRGGWGGVSEDVFPQMQCLHTAVCECACICASVFVCNLPGQIPL